MVLLETPAGEEEDTHGEKCDLCHATEMCLSLDVKCARESSTRERKKNVVGLVQ